MRSKISLFICATVSTFFMMQGAFARNQVHMSGSSTVFPYAKVVAETFGEVYSDYKTPIVESTGTGAGIKQFCQGDGENSLDIANASRPMTLSEFQQCLKNGVKQIEKITFGYDGIVFVTDIHGPSWNFTADDIYRALAEKVVIKGQLVKNPYTSWKQIDPKFPDWPIVMYIPSEKHGTREVFEGKLLLVGCEHTGAATLYKTAGEKVDQACIAVRKDGRAVDIDGDYSETLARLNANKTGVGVFGLFYYQNNADKLQVATVDNVEPTFATIANQTYPVSRPLFFYVKKSHLGFVPGLKEYVQFFLLEQMVGPEGTLEEYGLVASPDQQRIEQRQDFSDGKILTEETL